jgi:uncharacterized protein YegL
VLIVDRSGSMVPIAKETQNGIRLFVSEQREIPGRATLSLYQFDHDHDTVHDFTPLRDVAPYTLVPRGNTALLDACGFAITTVGEKLAAMSEAERPGKVIVVIATDGQENFSREYTLAQVRDMITRQRELYGWEFAYIGANQDAFAEAGAMGIPKMSSMDYAHTNSGTKNAWMANSAAATRYAGGQSVDIAYTEEERAASKSE